VRCDRGGLDQALVHLAVNARDAMPAGGTLRVEVTPVQVAAGARLDGPSLSPGPWVRLRVEDTGTGMTPEARAHAFEPFFTTKPSGLGMGLRISRWIVEAHGGRLLARNNDDRGATFEFHLPAAPHRAAAAAWGKSV
jgi:signal transduction histidine kinase